MTGCVKMTAVKKLLSGRWNEFKESSTGKYTSVSIDCIVLDADQVISIYKKVAEIEGVMML